MSRRGNVPEEIYFSFLLLRFSLKTFFKIVRLSFSSIIYQQAFEKKTPNKNPYLRLAGLILVTHVSHSANCLIVPFSQSYTTHILLMAVGLLKRCLFPYIIVKACVAYSVNLPATNCIMHTSLLQKVKCSIDDLSSK